MINDQIILSIIVISHEQREELRRCLDSILAMNLSFPYEIIVSDDRSTDGSYELACEFAGKSEKVRVKVEIPNGISYICIISIISNIMFF